MTNCLVEDWESLLGPLLEVYLDQMKGMETGIVLD